MKIYPLKFLDSYTKADTSIFFGREEEVNALYKMIFQTDILLIYGASGTGKTSLIQCGLASKFESHDWLDIYVRRGSNINTSLENALNKINANFEEEAIDLGWLDEIELEGTPKSTNTKNALEKQFKTIYQNAFRPIYLIFDQFEELYILGTKAEQETFVNNVKTILQLDQPVKMIFSIREEYLGYLYEFERDVPQLLKKKLRVEPMTSTKVQAVIEGITTADNSNISIDKKEIVPFTEQVFKKLQGQDETNDENTNNKPKLLTIELPYLQVFLDKLYLNITKDKTRQQDATFSVAALDDIGKIDDVLRDFLEEQVLAISQQLRPQYFPLNANHIWKILSPFVTLDGTKEPIGTDVITRKIEEVFEDKNQPATKMASFAKMDSTELTQDIIQAFIKSKIIRYLENDDVYEIAHDALAAKIAEKRTDEEIALLEVKRLIKSQAALKEDAREPFTQRQMNVITPYLDKLHLEPVEEALLEESYQKIEADLKAAEEERQAKIKAAEEQAEKDRILREQAEKQKEKAEIATKRATRFSRIAILIAVAAALAAVFAVISYNAAQGSEAATKVALKDAEKERRKAEISDSLAQIDKNDALTAKAIAEEKDSIAQVKAAEALASENTAKDALAKAKASEQKAKIALNEIAQREVKSGFTAVEQFQWEKAMEHLESANQSEEDSVKIEVKNILTDFVIIGLYRIPPKQWETELQPLFAAFQQTSSGVEVNFENKGNAILLADFEKAKRLALQGDKMAGRRLMIQAMQQKLDKNTIIQIMDKYAIPK